MHRIITQNVSDCVIDSFGHSNKSQVFKHFTALWMSLNADSVLTA